jgi:cytochrome c-type biogenesis protein CcmH/NrfF
MVLMLMSQLLFAQSPQLMEEPPLFDPPSLNDVEIRSERLGKMLRCPVCQGLSVADSRSDAAIAMKNRIKEFVEAGYSDQQVVDYFVSRYGEWALLKPKSSHWFVWSAPAFGLLVGLGIVGWQVRNRRTKPRNPKYEESLEGKNLYRNRILQELDGEE